MPRPSASPAVQPEESESEAESSRARKRPRRIPLACNVSGRGCSREQEWTDGRRGESSPSTGTDGDKTAVYSGEKLMIRCKSRKQRCNMDGRGPNDPCKSCEKAGTDCIIQEKPPKVC